MGKFVKIWSKWPQNKKVGTLILFGMGRDSIDNLTPAYGFWLGLALAEVCQLKT